MIVLVVATACSSSTNNGRTAQVTTPGAASTASIPPTTAAADPAADDPTSTSTTAPAGLTGLIFIDCDIDQDVVNAVDPTTGVTTTIRTFQLGNNVKPTYDCGHGSTSDPVFPSETLEDFNASFTRLAATEEDAADNSTRIGYITDGDPTFTDLTPTSTGFTSAPLASSAVFQPGSDDTLWYLSQTATGSDAPTTAHQIDVTTKTDTTGPTAPSPLLVSTSGKVLVAPARLTYTDWAQLARPDGSEYVGYSAAIAGPDYHLIRPGQTTIAIQSGPDAPLCQPSDFITTTRVLCTDVSVGDFATAPVLTITSLVPATDRHNYDPVLSPDKKTVAFLSTQGQTTSLYTVPVTGGQPTLISQLGPTPLGDLTAWLGS